MAGDEDGALPLPQAEAAGDAHDGDTTAILDYALELPPASACQDLAVAVRFLLSNLDAGMVIGRQGANHAAIQTATGAELRVSKPNEYFVGTTDRVLLISGPLRSVVDAFSRALEILRRGGVDQNVIDLFRTQAVLSQASIRSDGGGAPASSSTTTTTATTTPTAATTPAPGAPAAAGGSAPIPTVAQCCTANAVAKLLIPAILCGTVIGHSGETIRAFSKSSNVHISISPQDHSVRSIDYDRIVTLSGKMPGVLRAVALVVSQAARNAPPYYPSLTMHMSMSRPLPSPNPVGGRQYGGGLISSSSMSSLYTALAQPLGGSAHPPPPPRQQQQPHHHQALQAAQQLVSLQPQQLLQLVQQQQQAAAQQQQYVLVPPQLQHASSASAAVHKPPSQQLMAHSISGLSQATGSSQLLPVSTPLYVQSAGFPGPSGSAASPDGMLSLTSLAASLQQLYPQVAAASPGQQIAVWAPVQQQQQQQQSAQTVALGQQQIVLQPMTQLSAQPAGTQQQQQQQQQQSMSQQQQQIAQQQQQQQQLGQNRVMQLAPGMATVAPAGYSTSATVATGGGGGGGAAGASSSGLGGGGGGGTAAGNTPRLEVGVIMQVPEASVGLLTGGAVLQQMQDLLNVRMVVAERAPADSQNPQNPMRLVSIYGTPEMVHAAQQIVTQKLQEVTHGQPSYY